MLKQNSVEGLMKNFIWLFYLVFLVSCAQSIKAEQWQYIDPLYPDELFGITTEPNSFGINNLYLDAEICSVQDKYICIKTKGFSFYVPKKIEGKESSWTVNGITFKAHLMRDFRVLGVSEPLVYIIDSTGDHELRFLFSKERGLIAMGGSNKSKSRLFILSTACGFGANKTCLDSITLKTRN